MDTKKNFTSIREFIDRKKLKAAQKLLTAFGIENKFENIKRNGVVYGFMLQVPSEKAAEADGLIEK